MLDALFEYGARLRGGAELDVSAPMQLTVTQALEVLAAQTPRWQQRLAGPVAALQLRIDGLSHRTGTQLHDMLTAAHHFFRRDGAHTVRAAAATPGVEERFSLLWTDFFSRCLLDWLRDRDLINDADQLDVADTLVECAKLWIRDVAQGLTAEVEPAFCFLDSEREITATFERGPVKLRVRGKPDALVLRTNGEGIEVIDFKLGDPAQAELRIVQALFYMALLERAKGLKCSSGELVFFRANDLSARPVSGAEEVEQAFERFIGNDLAVNRLKQHAALRRQGRVPKWPSNLLITGAVGHGKTTLARCFARAVGRPLVEVQSASLVHGEDLLHAVDECLAAAGQKAEESRDASGHLVLRYPPVVLFLDDVQGLRRRASVWQSLLATPERRVVTPELEADFSQATIIAATSEPSRVPEALMTGFRRIELEPYRQHDIAAMVIATFAQSQLDLPEPLALQIASMGRCNPLRAQLFASELRDRHRASAKATPLTRETLLRLANSHWQVDEHGLAARDYHYLQALESGPKGLPALQHLLPQQDDELIAHIEPYLLHIGAIHRGARGRSLTVLGEQLLHRYRAKER